MVERGRAHPLGRARRLSERRHALYPAFAGSLLVASIALYFVVWKVIMHQPFHLAEPRLRSFDLNVYRAAAAMVLHSHDLYALRLYHHMRFTYPPFTALALLPNHWLSHSVDVTVIAACNLAELVAIVALARRLTPGSWGRVRATASWSAVAVICALALWSEPVVAEIGYGQIDLAVTLLLVWDLGRAPGSRGQGIAVGLAAGLKLTPLLFIPYLLLAGRPRVGLRAAVTFLATVAIGFVALPSDSAHYWGGVFLQSSRTGNIAAPINQSLLATVARAAHTTEPGVIWTVLIGVIAVAGVLVAARATRRGDDGIGFAVCAITSLLVSPVSWTHHWVLALPAIIQLVVWGRRHHRPLVIAAAGALAAVSFAYLPELVNAHSGLHVDLLGQLAIDPYVIVGLLAVVAVAIEGERGDLIPAAPAAVPAAVPAVASAVPAAAPAAEPGLRAEPAAQTMRWGQA